MSVACRRLDDGNTFMRIPREGCACKRISSSPPEKGLCFDTKLSLQTKTPPSGGCFYLVDLREDSKDKMRRLMPILLTELGRGAAGDGAEGAGEVAGIGKAAHCGYSATDRLVCTNCFFARARRQGFGSSGRRARFLRFFELSPGKEIWLGRAPYFICECTFLSYPVHRRPVPCTGIPSRTVHKNRYGQ